MPSRVPPGSKETASGETSLTFFKARVAPQGLRAFCLPRWRNRDTRMSQKHEVPGSNPGWGTSFFAGAETLPCRSGNATGTSGPFFYNLGCGKCRAGIAQQEERDVASVETRVRGSPAAPWVSVV